MKKSLILIVLGCCFSVATFSSNVNSTFKVEDYIQSTPNSDDLRPKFRIGFNAPQIDHRQILLTIDENTSDGFDWGYDAQIFQIFNDDMYWVFNDSKYVIQATNCVTIEKEFALGIKTINGGIITIGIDAIENPIEGFKVYLKDKELNKIYNIEEKDYQITLPAGEYHSKYAIVFVSTEVLPIEEEEIEVDIDDESDNGDSLDINTIEGEIDNTPNVNINLENKLLMYVANGNNTLTIKNKEQIKINNITLYNRLGQITQVWDTNNCLNDEQLCLQINAKQGVYIIQATTEQGNISKRIVLKYL